MRKFFRFVLVVLSLCGIGLVLCYAGSRAYKERLIAEIAGAGIDATVFKPYILGTEISFADGGNSADYINTDDGWGGQEPEHRCATGKQTTVRFYIPDSIGGILHLVVDGFGVFPPKTAKYQEVKVYANGTLITTWTAGYEGPFSVDIPNNIITDGKLILLFQHANPYSPPGDSRKIGMAVKSMKISRVFGAQTKRKIGRWIKYNLMGGGIRQEYDTSMSTDDNWL